MSEKRGSSARDGVTVVSDDSSEPEQCQPVTGGAPQLRNGTPLQLETVLLRPGVVLFQPVTEPLTPKTVIFRPVLGLLRPETTYLQSRNGALEVSGGACRARIVVPLVTNIGILKTEAMPFQSEIACLSGE